MWRLTKAQLKAGRWAEEEEKADSRVEARGLSGARIVCQSPSIPLTMQPHKQTPADTVTRLTKKAHARTCMSLRPAVTTFWNPQNALVKRGSAPDSLPQPPSALEEDTEGQARLAWKDKRRQQRGSKFEQSDRHTWCIHSPDVDIVKWTQECGLSRPWNLADSPHTWSSGPEKKAVRACGRADKSVGVSLGMSARACEEHGHQSAQTTLSESH